MEILINNVGFGEYSIFQEHNINKLVVDCGSLNASVISSFQLARLSLNTPILISHLHEDHYNGFLRYAKTYGKFKKMYLPYISTKNGIILLEEALKDLYFRRGLSGYKTIKSFIDILDICDFRDIKFLEKDDYICEINSVVLWPNNLCNFDFISSTNNINKNDDNEYDNDYLRFKGLLNEFINLFTDKNKNKTDNINELKVKIHDELLKFESLDLTRTNNKNIINCENACSVVFCDKNNEKFLFTGDITKKVQKWLFDNEERYSNHYYKLMKIPHHGTQNYFDSSILPKCESYFISNGFSKQINWRISNKVCLLNAVFCTGGAFYGCNLCPRFSAHPVVCCPHHVCFNNDFYYYL